MKDAKKRETGVSMPTKSKQAEEERLLLESSRHVTRTATALFYGNGFIVSALPLCTYLNVFAWDSGEGGGERKARGSSRLQQMYVQVFTRFLRAVLARDGARPRDLCTPVRCGDSAVYVPSVRGLQEDENQFETQVSTGTHIY